jgi:hypothetical protein
MSNDVTYSGPLFDAAQRTRLGEQFTRDACQVIAEKGAEFYKGVLNASIRHPTMPDYGGRRIRTSLATTSAMIYDSNAVYGPWLEGQGSRNSPVTRFPGYWSARRATQTIQNNSAAWVENAVETYVDGLNGGA